MVGPVPQPSKPRENQGESQRLDLLLSLAERLESSKSSNAYQCGDVVRQLSTILFDKTKLATLSEGKIKQADFFRRYFIAREIRLLKPFREKLAALIKDPDKLPSIKEIDEAFPPEHFEYNKRMAEVWADLIIKNLKVWEILTTEFIEAWAEHLLPKIKKLNEQGVNTVRFLEVGAADGKLSHFLEKALKAKGANVEFVAVDDRSWEKEEKGAPRGDNVKEMDYRDGLKIFQPHIVISSWMPFGEDFTVNFRATDSVIGYILLGNRKHSGTKESWLIDNGTVKADEVNVIRDFQRMIATGISENRSLPKIDGFQIIQPKASLLALQCSAERDTKTGAYLTSMQEFWKMGSIG